MANEVAALGAGTMLDRFFYTRFDVTKIYQNSKNSQSFRAVDRWSGAEVFVKSMPATLMRRNPDYLGRIAWHHGLNHPLFSKILGAGITPSGRCYLVRPWSRQGNSLERKDSPRAMSIARQLIPAAALLHSAGVVHGRIKPANLWMLDERICLLDGGLPPPLPNTLRPHEFNFSAPEILQGSEATPESDLYSVGAILYALFSDRNLFEDADPGILWHKCIHAVPTPLSELSDLPRELTDGVSGLISKDPPARKAALRRLSELLPGAPGPAVKAPFSGRQEELNRATTILQTDQPGIEIVLIGGDAGIGKTRFVEELRFRHELTHGHFLIGRCYPRDNRPFEPVLQILNERFGRPDKKLEEWNRTDATGYAHSLEALLPESGVSQSPGAGLPQPSPAKLLADLTGTLISIARRDSEVIVCVEDIHWADEGTLKLLEQLALRAGEARLSLVITSRSPTNAIFNLFRLPSISLNPITLGPLGSSDATRVARLMARDTAQIPWVVKNGAGNPLFLEECARCSDVDADRLPRKVTDVLLERVNRLKPPLRSTAEVFSLFPKPVPAQLAEKVCGSLPGINVKGIDDLLATGVLALESGRLRFSHDGIRESLYRNLKPRHRRFLHRAIYEILAAEGAGIATLAYHAEKGGLPDTAADAYAAAARERREQNHYRAAIELFAAARRLFRRQKKPGMIDLELSFSECLGSAGRIREARRVLLGILDSIPPYTESKATAYRNLAACCRSEPALSVRYNELAMEHLPMNSSNRLRFRLNQAQAYAIAGKMKETSKVLDQIRDSPGEARTLLPEFILLKGSIFLALGDHAHALKLLRRDVRDEVLSASAGNNAAICSEHLGDLSGALHLQKQTLAASRKLGLLFREAQSLGNIGAYETKKGRLRKARVFFDQANRFYRSMPVTRSGNNQPPRLFSLDQAFLNMLVGEYPVATEQIQAAVRLLKHDTSSRMAIWIALRATEYYCQISDTSKIGQMLHRIKDAELLQVPFFRVEHTLILVTAHSQRPHDRMILEHALQLTDSLGTLYQKCRVLMALAQDHLETGSLKEARAYLAGAQQLAREHGYGLLQPRIFLLRALTARSASAKENSLSRAVRSASRLPLPELVAEASYHLALHQLERGNQAEGVENLQKSVSVIERLAGTLPKRLQRNYLRVAWRKQAQARLRKIRGAEEVADPKKEEQTAMVRESASKRLYETTIALGRAADVKALADIVNRTLVHELNCRAACYLTINEPPECSARRLNVTDSLSKKLSALHKRGHDQPHYETGRSPQKANSGSHGSIVWIPLTVRNNRFGGIYLDMGRRSLRESEMEFLTTIGVVASNVLAVILWASAKPEPRIVQSRVGGIIGRSRQIREVCSQIEVAARTASTVLIEGESGTGKELVARAIHEHSSRFKGPLITVDCGAIPESLIESELFGSRKGSFTGAATDRTGLFEAAHGGTLFLDEIANTSPSLQARLLRVLQEREVRRIGETRGRSVDVRLIAATNSNLNLLVERGLFRQDLLYRLQVLHIGVPPLRERRADIPEIARAFLDELNRTDKTRKRFAKAAMEELMLGRYPGNVRELQNVVERAYVMASGNTITQVDVRSKGQTGSESDDIAFWFKELREGKTDFWDAVHSRYKARDIPREKVIALMDLGLRETRGSYKSVARIFQVKDTEYRKFMDFLRRNHCKPDFRPYRRLGPE